MKNKFFIALLAGAVGSIALLASGCANEGGYDLSWTVGGQPAQKTRACAVNALDIVRVQVVRGEKPGACVGEVVDESDYSCTDGRGEASPIEGGRYTICAEGLSPAQVRLTGVVAAAQIEIRRNETAVADVDLPAVPPCDNGLDDDDDGRVDEHTDGGPDGEDTRCLDLSDAGD